MDNDMVWARWVDTITVYVALMGKTISLGTKLTGLLRKYV